MNNKLKDLVDENRDKIETMRFNRLGRVMVMSITVITLLCAALAFYWDSEPGLFDVKKNQTDLLVNVTRQPITGSATITTLITMADIMLHKPGGYLSNDIAPPGIFMDNIPNWELGVLVQIRDMARTLRNNLSRSQSQSQEDVSLVTAENQFYFDNE